ncbi:Pycsar system effector family protein [Polaribacter glomeratus]|uniref:Pycsar effector protein domain-containing protein n=1 Tax=Polaribacter glomeratus TaxID=102 RepID=A0A2S7WFN5_9FLAO|nr:Pycsar system effector family protein [Polaribacter glomeratus]PQJ76407.1 hypothetical protein BTO16_10865 [Polaribacter glomeratus]TXD65540.1 hypothetical protein ESX12_10170 [Polaribacter glomeratus]
MNKELLEIHSNVKDWLKFAEAKNAMLIAFNAASIYGVSKLPFLNKTEGLNFIDAYFSFVIILLIFSTVTCLISFVPRLKFIHLSISNNKDKENIFFFEHLGGSSPKKILESLKAKGVKEEFSEIDEDIAVQIHSLANVTRNKYSFFTIAVWFTVAACITPLIAVIFAGYNYKK